MAYIINYDPTIHDLYLYPSGPTLDRIGATYTWVYPNSYNSSLYINYIDSFSPGATLPTMDFSGLALRRKGASTVFNLSGLGGGTMPDSAYFDGLAKPSVSWSYPLSYENNANFFRNASTSEELAIVNDYNHWNNGEVPACLISPMHVWAGGHMFEPFMGPSGNSGPFRYEYGTTNDPYIDLKFLGKDNTIYEKRARLAFFVNDCEDSQCAAECCTPSFKTYDNSYFQNSVLGKTFGTENTLDTAILELEEPFRSREIENLKIYKMANLSSWPNGKPVFLVNPNGAVTVWRCSLGSYDTQYYFDSNLFKTTHSKIPYQGYINLDYEKGQSGYYNVSTAPFFGDSCNLVFGYHDGIKETVLLGQRNAPQNLSYDGFSGYSSRFFGALKDWVYQRTTDVMGVGYHIGWIDYSVETDCIQFEGKVYTKKDSISNIVGNTGTTYIFGGLTKGTTYSIIVAAFTENNNATVGFSGFAGPITVTTNLTGGSPLLG
jgi:hypothetical protein